MLNDTNVQIICKLMPGDSTNDLCKKVFYGIFLIKLEVDTRRGQIAAFYVESEHLLKNGL